MAYLAQFQILNTDFIPAAFGLEDNYFSIDIETSLQASKQVGVTQFPLLDGTTRIDTVSRQPGTLNFQGKAGSVSNSSSFKFVPNGVGTKDRLQVIVELLEYLRDNAYVLNILTEHKNYYNYIITGVNFGQTSLGVIDVNFSMKEFISFGSEISTSLITPEVFGDEDAISGTTTDANAANLALFYFDLIPKTYDDLSGLIYSLLTNSDLAEPYIIKLGGNMGFNADESISAFNIDKPFLNIDTKNRDTNGAWFGGWVTDIDARYYPARTPDPTNQRVFSGATIETGTVADEFKLKFSLPYIYGGYPISSKSSILYEETKDGKDKSYSYRPDHFLEEGSRNIKIEIIQGNTTIDTKNDTDILITPRFSNIYNGVNPKTGTNTGSLENDLIIKDSTNNFHKYALNFIRQTSDPNVYEMIPNLLGSQVAETRGYLYPANFITKTSVYSSGYKYKLQLNFIYFHPRLVRRLKEILNLAINEQEGHLLYGKELRWW